MSKILIPDGTRVCFQQVQFPKIVFWKVCTKCEYESLINPEQHSQCGKRNQLRSIEAELPEVEDHGEKTHRSNVQNTKFQSQK